VFSFESMRSLLRLLAIMPLRRSLPVLAARTDGQSKVGG
jgi:hypothetical protein